VAIACLAVVAGLFRVRPSHGRVDFFPSSHSIRFRALTHATMRKLAPSDRLWAFHKRRIYLQLSKR
jgi:hypothetical protein